VSNPYRLILSFVACLLLTTNLNAQESQEEEKASQVVWGGMGLAQTESFWADRAPVTPLCFVRYESFLPIHLWPHSAWESQMRFLGGVSGVSQWRSGTTDIGDETSRVVGELGIAIGPSYEGTLFTLGADIVAVGVGGVDLFMLNAMGQQRTQYQTRFGLAAGTGIYAGFKHIYIRQELLMGYGTQGYHHQLRTGLALVF
jgi:hypothetical protein